MKSFALFLALLPLAASAATITVNTTADNTTAGDSQCTLREAIANVNAAADTTGGDCTAGSGAGDTIKFGFAMPAKITLRLGQVLIQRDIGIANAAPGSLQIDGAYRSRVFEIAAGNTSLSHLTIAHGSDGSAGGGIMVDAGANLSLIDCLLTGNKVTGANDGFSDGGAIYNAGTVNLTDCKLTANTARASEEGYGGAISNVGTLTLTHCTLSGNKVVGNDSGENDGGGIHSAGGTVSVTKCTFAKNTARTGADAGMSDGGAISIAGGTLDASDCLLIGNRAVGSIVQGGVIYLFGGTVTLTDSTLFKNVAVAHKSGISDGGGLFVTGSDDEAGVATLTGCTLTRNAAFTPGTEAESYGGAIENDDTLTLTNCTLTRNSANVCTNPGFCLVAGGAIESQGDTTLVNCTLSGNTVHPPNAGGADEGLFVNGGGIDGLYTVITNTIMANNGGGNCSSDTDIDASGHNLSSDSTCFASGGTDLLNTQPQLAPLRNYGGVTQTIALCTAAGVPAGCRTASPAIDAGDDSVTGPPDNLITDQRGLPRLSGAHVDIGAYEVPQ